MKHDVSLIVFSNIQYLLVLLQLGQRLELLLDAEGHTPESLVRLPTGESDKRQLRVDDDLEDFLDDGTAAHPHRQTDSPRRESTTGHLTVPQMACQSVSS